MAINFPSNPSIGDSYSNSGRSWVFDGTGWQVQQSNINFSAIASGLGYIPISPQGGTMTGNLVLQSALIANGTAGAPGTALVSNGTGIYWASSVSAAAAGDNTAVQFNDSGTTTGNLAFTWTKTSNTLTVSNTVSIGGTLSISTSVTGNSSGLYPQSNTVGTALGNTISRWNLNANTTESITYNVAGAILANSSGIYHATLMNAATVNAATLSVGTSLIGNSLGVYHTGLMNAASFNTSGIIANTSGIYPTSNAAGTALGGTLNRWIITANSGTFTSTVNAVTSVNSALLTVGTNFIANTLGAYHTGVVNAASHTTTGVTANVTGVYPASNASGTGLGSATTRWVLIANSGDFSATVNAVTSVNSALITVGTSFIANSTGSYHTGTMNAASFTTTGVRANTLGIYPTSNTSGQNLGNTISRWAMFGLTLDLATTATFSGNVQISSLGVGTAASGVAGEIRATNNITAYFASDKRLKENVRKVDNALDKIDLINGVYFDWTDEYIKNNGGEDGYFVRKQDVGVIAQEIQGILPEAVATRQDGYMAVRYEKIIAVLIEAIKELRAEVKQLKDLK